MRAHDDKKVRTVCVSCEIEARLCQDDQGGADIDKAKTLTVNVFVSQQEDVSFV